MLKAELMLANDCCVVKPQTSENDPAIFEVSNEKIPDGYQAVDVGVKSIELFSNALDNCATIVWNGSFIHIFVITYINIFMIIIGPLGKFENKLYSTGNNEMIKYLSTRTNLGAITVLCGGDTISALDSFDPDEKYSFSHISTGLLLFIH
jgi:phosphoglycerate kinase